MSFSKLKSVEVEIREKLRLGALEKKSTYTKFYSETT